MIIENDKVVLVDLSKVTSATLAGSCASCGGEDSTFQRQMSDLKYINISQANTSLFKSYAKANFSKGKIVPGSVKVYPCRGNDKPPKFQSNTLDEVKTNIIDFYNAFRTTDTALDTDLAQKMALAIKEYYVFGDTKKKCEEAMYEDFPTKIYQSKAFGPILEKWVNLRIKAKNYNGNYNEPYLPDINITCKPYLAMCPDGSNVTINVVKKDGTTETFCKSALIIINPRSDFGYRINGIATAGDLEDSSYSNWSSYLSSNASAYQQGILTRAQAALNSPIPNQVINYAPAGTGGDGPVFRFRLSNSKSNLFSIQVTIPIGSGPEFGQNWFYPPILTFAVSPDAVATMYNQYQNFLTEKRQAAEAARAANNAAITNPNPPVTTPPTTIDYNLENPVVVPPTTPVNPNITDPVNNVIGDGTFGGDSGSFDLGL